MSLNIWAIIGIVILGVVFLLVIVLLLAFSFNLSMPRWFREWSCKKGLHSFRLRQGYDEENEYPTAICVWCSEDCVYMFGRPPQKFIDLRTKILAQRGSNLTN